MMFANFTVIIFYFLGSEIEMSSLTFVIEIYAIGGCLLTLLLMVILARNLANIKFMHAVIGVYLTLSLPQNILSFSIFWVTGNSALIFVSSVLYWVIVVVLAVFLVLLLFFSHKRGTPPGINAILLGALILLWVAPIISAIVNWLILPIFITSYQSYQMAIFAEKITSTIITAASVILLTLFFNRQATWEARKAQLGVVRGVDMRESDTLWKGEQGT